MDFFYTHEGCDDLHDTCSKSIIKLGANRQLVNGISNLLKLAHSIALFINEDDRVDTGEIRADVADCLVSLTEIAITMGSEEQMRQQILLATERLKRKVYQNG